LFVFYLYRFGSCFFYWSYSFYLARRCRVCYRKGEDYKKTVCVWGGGDRVIWFSLLAFNNIKFWIVNRFWIVNHKRYVMIHAIHNVSYISSRFVSKRYWIVNRTILTSLVPPIIQLIWLLDKSSLDPGAHWMLTFRSTSSLRFVGT
jgi:hypothetical protein